MIAVGRRSDQVKRISVGGGREYLNDVMTASRGVSGSPSPRGQFTENLRCRMESVYTFKPCTVSAVITRREQRSVIEVQFPPILVQQFPFPVRATFPRDFHRER